MQGRGLAALLADTRPNAIMSTVPAARSRVDADGTSTVDPVVDHAALGAADWGRVRFRPAPRRGHRRPGAGWNPATAPVSVWRMTTDQAPVLWPFIASPPLPATGAVIGVDEHAGGPFHADPHGWVLDDSIPVTNPNMFVFGKPGQGKSGTTKAFVLRMLDFGYSALILGDPKDEYEPLCHALGVQPFVIGHGLPARINPLAFGPLGQHWQHLGPEEAKRRAAIVFARWLTLIRALVGSQHLAGGRVPYGPSDDVVVRAALEDLTGHTAGHTRLRETTIPALWHRLNTPTPELIHACRYADEQQFLDGTRLLRDSLGKLVTGALAGLFDDHTTITVDWDAPIQSLSLSRLEPLGDEAVGIALTCLNSWGRGQRETTPATGSPRLAGTAGGGRRRIVVRDEAWRQLRLGLDAVASFDADLRFSRSTGDIQLAVAHKPSDPETAGDAGTQAAMIARDLLHLADIKILHGQDHQIAADLQARLDLNPLAVDAITGWARHGKGRALWILGDRYYKVQTVLHPLEAVLADTNTAIRPTHPRHAARPACSAGEGDPADDPTAFGGPHAGSGGSGQRA